MTYVVQEAWVANDYMVGYYDARLEGGESLPGIDEYYSQCFDLREEQVRRNKGIWESDLPEHPERAIKLGTVGTRYATFYRVHGKRYFKWGAAFPSNWVDDERKRTAAERFSPRGTVGHYLGLTADAALDEAHFYGDGQIDPSEKFFLAVECYFDNVLYLTDVAILTRVWHILELESAPVGDMYFKIMDPCTANAITDKIGLWARDAGFSGIIFPSARWGQELDIERMRASGLCPFPALNSVPIGCHLDRVTVHNAVIGDQLIYESSVAEGCKPVPVYAEPNLVLFSGAQLSGRDRAIFYTCSSLEDRDEVIRRDRRLQKKSYEHWQW